MLPAATVRLLDVEIAHHRVAPGLREDLGRPIFVHADADEPDRYVIQPPDEEDEPAATLQVQLTTVPLGRARRESRDDGGGVPSSMRRTSIVLTAPMLAAATHRTRPGGSRGDHFVPGLQAARPRPPAVDAVAAPSGFCPNRERPRR